MNSEYFLLQYYFKIQEVDEPNGGFTQLVFPLIRSLGTIGEVKLHWSVEGVSDDRADPALDLQKSNGGFFSLNFLVTYLFIKSQHFFVLQTYALCRSDSVSRWSS